MTKIIVTDRYLATGTPYPDPDTMCIGPCEGMGFYPVFNPDWKGEESGSTVTLTNPELLSDYDQSEWQRKELEEPTTDGWHFVQCPDCKGTRLRKVVPISVEPEQIAKVKEIQLALKSSGDELEKMLDEIGIK